MKLRKRIVAGISAIVMFMSISLNSGFVAIADKSETTNVEMPIDTNNTVDDEVGEETTTTTSLETTTETTTTTTKDTSPPNLNVNIPIQDKWIKYDDLQNWQISASEGATILYQTYDITTETERIKPDVKDAKNWEGVDKLLEGSYYIVFWAVYPDGKCGASVSEVYQYHLDKSEPEPFNLDNKTEEEWNTKYFVISNENEISDAISGINKIYYKINDWNTNLLSQDQIKYDVYGNIVGFSFRIADWLEEATITVYIEDMAGNVNEQKIENVTNDPTIPQIIEVAITSEAQQGATILECLTFGNEALENLIRHIYANDKYFLSVTINEEDLTEIIVNINGEVKSITSEDWICNDTSNSIEKTYYIELSHFDDSMKKNEANAISVIASDDQNDSDEIKLAIDDVECTVLYDPKSAEDCKISFKPDITPVGDSFFGEITEDNAIAISMSDDVGIAEYKVYVDDACVTSVVCEETATETITETVVVTDHSGAVVTDTDGEEQTETVTSTIQYNVIIPSTEYSLKLNDYKENKDYVVKVELIDLAGNYNVNTYNFTVDSTPPLIDNFNYTVNQSMLKFLTFGIFGKETISIDINVHDNDSGIGVDPKKVFLYWAPTADGELHKYSATPIDEENGLYRFEDLPIDNEAVPYIVVYDKIGNSNTFYFATKDTAESLNVGELILEDEITTDGVTLVLEKDIPSVSVTVPSTYIEYTVGGETWYGDDIEYVVSASDSNSGLNYVEIQENDGISKKETDFEGVTFNANRFQDEAIYTYKLIDANDYIINAIAHDNAGNSSVRTELKVHIDKEKPAISKFVFGDQEDYGSEVVKTTYGYYFKEETSIRVYVNDPGIASGINRVTLYLSNINGATAVKTLYSTDEKAYITDETGTYAVFTIPMGFKGTVAAEAVDNVEHTSGLVNADGSIIEDDAIHNQTSSIDITEIVATDKVDAANVPLYNRNIPLTITVKDTFSGISTIEWSIANDGESGVIIVANDGRYESNSNAVTIDTVEMESNLVASMQFTLSVDDNSNGNVVLIKLTDRSGNSSEVSKTYSIDTTTPTITAALSNQTPYNSMYYNTDQTVTISITDRNFDASGVKFMLNGSEQIIGNWASTGEDDAAVHIGTFTINTDGDYSYSITFSDMAGNTAEVFTQSMFVIDKTSPIIKTNFDEFETEQEKHYFGCDSINKTAIITIIEHNFSAKDANAEIFRLEPGSEHDIRGVKSTTVSGWSDNGDEHTLEIPFEENDDGVYLIRVTPVDLASNSTIAQETVVFEIDFTNPIIAERNGVYAKDEEKSYKNLEIYNEKTGVEENFIPSVTFSDTNFDHIEYDLTVYTPEYSNGKEIGTIIPETDSGNISEKIYSLPEFKKDGVYSVDLTAVDKAGNRSVLCRNTSVLMMESDVLAYISNSNKAESKGWYSLQKDENTPISKRPDAFSDLDITVFAQENSKTSIILRDENGKSQDTGITAENSEGMYAVGVYNYTLPKEYFADNYPEGTNKDLYLWAENTYNKETSHITLGWIRIDALAPTCTVPSDLKDWKSYTSKTKTITLSNISESLDKSKCIVYDNGKAISADYFDYSDETDTLSYTLEKGWHDLSFVLVDEAGNTYTVQEISSIQVGLFYCLWFRILCSIFIAGVIAGVVIIIVKKKRAVNK
ncbi:MAG: Ig-like domain repeat protein [Ruminococcus flavefaciens]|nr:Ig-like domain repeat protein [Ruminococcus flavefaciens]